ncbi:MAG: hypothetical protein WCO00_06155 [Rhodospirillaceae bacterium]
MTDFWPKWLYNVAVDADKEVSAVTLGDPRETISSRLGKAYRGDFGKVWKYLTLPLHLIVNAVARAVWGQPDHCLDAINDEVGSESPLSEEQS